MSRFLQQNQSKDFDSLTQKRILQLNEALNTNYRSTPYDISISFDLVQKINVYTLHYIDINYNINLANKLYEDFDMSLMTCRTDIYVKMYGEHHSNKLNSDNLYYTLNSEIEGLIKSLTALRDTILEDLKELYEYTCKNNKEIYHHFFGECNLSSGELINEFINCIDDFIESTPQYICSIEYTPQVFYKYFKKILHD